MTSETAAAGRLDRRWLVFWTIAVGTYVSVMDQTGVSLALPRIADHFDASIPAVQWVTLGYILTTGSLILPMGRLSDIVGRKRVYTAGFGIFILGAVLTGLSVSLTSVILFKVLQGVGSAMIQANGMAIVTSSFPASERGKVIGLFLTVVGLGAISGPVIGGAVVGAFGWRFVFFMGVPLGIASVIAAMVFLKSESAAGPEPPAERVGFDWLGAALSSAALVIFLLSMTNAYRIGWASPIILAAFAGVGVLLVAFIRWELRAQLPMLALDLFRRRLFSFGNATSFIVFLSGSAVFFLMPFYLQEVLGYSPGRTGLILVPGEICLAIVGPVAGRLSDRYGPRSFIIAGLVLTMASLLTVSRSEESTPLAVVVVALAVLGAGMGAFFSTNASSVLSAVERSRYGIATAFMNMSRNIASVTGVGMATAIVAGVMGSLGYEPSLEAITSAGGGEGVRAAFVQGAQTAYLVGSGFMALAIVLSSFKGESLAEEPDTGDSPAEVSEAGSDFEVTSTA